MDFCDILICSLRFTYNVQIAAASVVVLKTGLGLKTIF